MQTADRLLSIDDLKNGRRPRVSESELAALLGCSNSKLQKDRTSQRGIAYRKDLLTGRIYYDSGEVLSYLEQPPRFTSTCQYSTKDQSERLEKARAAKQKKAVSANA